MDKKKEKSKHNVPLKTVTRVRGRYGALLRRWRRKDGYSFTQQNKNKKPRETIAESMEKEEKNKEKKRKHNKWKNKQKKIKKKNHGVGCAGVTASCGEDCDKKTHPTYPKKTREKNSRTVAKNTKHKKRAH